MDQSILKGVLEKLKERFDPNQVKQRQGPKKKNPATNQWEPIMFDYVPEPYVRERLDEVLPLGWSWEVLSTKEYQVVKSVYDKGSQSNVDQVVGQVAVCGRLTLNLPDGTTVFRDAFGGSDLDKGSQAADPYKIADSNAFKKAAFKFGVAAYLGIEGLEDDAASAAPSQTQQSNKGSNPFRGGGNNKPTQQRAAPFVGGPGVDQPQIQNSKDPAARKPQASSPANPFR